MYLRQHYSTASRKRTRTNRYNEESWQAERHTPNTGISSKATLPSAWRDRCTTPVCCQLWHMAQENWTLTKQTQNKLAAATKIERSMTKIERSMLNTTYKDRETNIWVRERTKFIYIINTVRKMKWSWAGHINRRKDDRWTPCVTTWRPYDKKIRQGRPAKRRRDDLDKYWSDTIWQRTAQEMLSWRRPSPNHGTQRLPNDDVQCIYFVKTYFHGVHKQKLRWYIFCMHEWTKFIESVRRQILGCALWTL